MLKTVDKRNKGDGWCSEEERERERGRGREKIGEGKRSEGGIGGERSEDEGG